MRSKSILALTTALFLATGAGPLSAQKLTIQGQKASPGYEQRLPQERESCRFSEDARPQDWGVTRIGDRWCLSPVALP